MEYEKLQKLLAEILEVEPEQIRREKSFVRDYGADSLMLYQILMGVEAVFGVIVEEEEAVRWSCTVVVSILCLASPTGCRTTIR